MPRASLPQTESPDPYLKARALATRYDTTIRSINTLVALGRIPKPDLIMCGKRYWKLSSLEASDRKNTAGAVTKFAGRAKLAAAE